MGDEAGGDDEKPVHSVSLDAFELGKYTTTNAEFLEFVNATGYDIPENFLKGAASNLPATHINWFDAVAYCRWLSQTTPDHYRLPTEAEWEYAARSGSAENIFPWGTRGWNERPDLQERFRNGPEPVGSFEANAFGLHDMGMNVHEWCLDWYDPSYYSNSPSANPEGPLSGTRRSSRGGSWRHQIKITRCAARSSIPPEYRYADYGFRVLHEID
jgi:formylglycine-generating enzyme